MKDNIKLFWGCYGILICSIIGVAIIAYDPIRTGIDGYVKDLWTIGPRGSLGLLACIVGAMVSRWCDKQF